VSIKLYPVPPSGPYWYPGDAEIHAPEAKTLRSKVFWAWLANETYSETGNRAYALELARAKVSQPPVLF
jgi:hypothetical protein